MKQGFNAEKYIEEQSKHILKRINEGKSERLYLEFGGKLVHDKHAMRVLPGFDENAKIKLLEKMSDHAEIIICIYSGDIISNKTRQDFGITYDLEVMRLIDTFRKYNLSINSVVVTRYEESPGVEMFINKLKRRGITVYKHFYTKGYPTDVETIVSDNGYGANPYIEVTKPLVVVTAPGGGSGKLATCLSQLYHEYKKGKKVRYAKFETFPIWSIPLKHPVNIAYEAATADLKDVNMIDNYHLDAYGELAVNYNRDLEAFPVVKRIIEKITGESEYLSPTDMGVNRAGFCICDDEVCKKYLPIDPETNDIFDRLKNGVILCKLMNVIQEGTIDDRVINTKDNMNIYQQAENINLALSAAKSLGIATVGLNKDVFFEANKNPSMVLGLMWQVAKHIMLQKINLKNFPELVRLLNPGEQLSDLLKLSPEQLLLRWFNYHLKNAGYDKPITNFSGDIKDSEKYTILLNQLDKEKCDKSALNEPDLNKRAAKVLEDGKKLGAKAFISPKDIVSGNGKLNTIFVAALFNACPGLDPPTEKEKMDAAGLLDDDAEGAREERAFRMWINSLNLQDENMEPIHINNLYEESKSGILLLKTIDRIKPNVVNWKVVDKKCSNPFKIQVNCQEAVDACKKCKFSIVGIGGADIREGKHILPDDWSEHVNQWDERLSHVFNRGFWDGYYQGQTLGEWNDKPGSLATEKKVYVGRGVKYFNKLQVAEFKIEAAPLHVGDRILVTGPTTGPLETTVEEIRYELKPVEEALQGQHISIPLVKKIRNSDKLYKLVPNEYDA